MISQFRDRKSIRKRAQILRTLLWSLVFVGIFVSGFIAWSHGFFQRISIPFWTAKNTVSETASDSLYLIRTKASVFRENQILKEENQMLRVDMTDYSLLKKENTELKEMLGRVPAKTSFILSAILAKPSQSPYDTLVIDAGLREGVKEGDTVFAYTDTPIGRVRAVYETTSLVVLYSNPGQETEAIIEGVHATVTVVGRGGGNFEMSIPIDLVSEKGTRIVFPGLSLRVLAIVEDVISSPTDPLKKVLLRSPVNIQNLRWVSIQR